MSRKTINLIAGAVMLTCGVIFHRSHDPLILIPAALIWAAAMAIIVKTS